MGLKEFGAPRKFILELKNEFNLSTFVETGTFLGGTAVWASEHFAQIFTIELSRTLYDQTFAQHKDIPNIQFIFGDSRIELNTIVEGLNEPAIFWLDGHWSGSNTYGAEDECPLLRELQVISQSKIAHSILIDDARLFLSPPPLPHKVSEWPTIDEVISCIKSAQPTYYIVIVNDIIIAVPNSQRSFVANYWQTINTQIWQDLLKAGKESKIRLGLGTTRQGVYLLRQGIAAYIKQVFNS